MRSGDEPVPALDTERDPEGPLNQTARRLPPPWGAATSAPVREREDSLLPKPGASGEMAVSTRHPANPSEQFPLVKSLRKLYVVLKLYNCYCSLFKNYSDLIDQLD